ncbi:unnamed protein product [Linum trigynum]|uniref:Uncharacterized protein n=1 Tax=Linum trigynum TaxID=586398 RepID=A0AAV2FCZ2_9ROSI
MHNQDQESQLNNVQEKMVGEDIAMKECFREIMPMVVDNHVKLDSGINPVLQAVQKSSWRASEDMKELHKTMIEMPSMLVGSEVARRQRVVAKET